MRSYQRSSLRNSLSSQLSTSATGPPLTYSCRGGRTTPYRPHHSVSRVIPRPTSPSYAPLRAPLPSVLHPSRLLRFASPRTTPSAFSQCVAPRLPTYRLLIYWPRTSILVHTGDGVGSIGLDAAVVGGHTPA
jgi:hypothetical protein